MVVSARAAHNLFDTLKPPLRHTFRLQGLRLWLRHAPTPTQDPKFDDSEFKFLLGLTLPSPGSSQGLELFIKFISVLCSYLPDASFSQSIRRKRM